MAESLEYRGYRVVIGQFGSGWRASIHAPESTELIIGAQPDDPPGHHSVNKAKRLIDVLLDKSI